MLQRQELRKAGLKVTLPRLKILEILEKSKDRHLSAEDIYRELLDSGEEIARMLGGVEITRRTRDHAAEMLHSHRGPETKKAGA